MSLIEVVLVVAGGVVVAAGVCALVVTVAVRRAHKHAPPVHGALDE